MNFLVMRKKACQLIAKARELHAAMTAEGVELSSEEIEAKAAEIKALTDEATELRARADQLEAVETDLDGLIEDDDDGLGGGAADVDPPSVTLPDARRVFATARDQEAALRCGFEDFGDMALSVFRANPLCGAFGPPDKRLSPLFRSGVDMQAAATGLSQGVGPEGGWLVPPAFVTTIWDGMNNEVDNLLSLTDQFPIQSDTLELLANAETSRVTGSRYGGIDARWLAEAEQMTASKPTLRKVKLEPQQLAVLVYVTDKLLGSGGSAVNAWLTRAAISEINWYIGNAIVDGDGAGKPKGILKSGSLIAVAKETSQAADTFNQENVAKMWARMHARSRRTAVWLINQDVDPQLNLMVSLVKNVAGTENVGGFQASLYDRPADTLMGRPIIRTEWNKTVGDEGDVILADLQSYVTAIKEGIQSAMSMHLRFDYNESAFRFIIAVDGQPWTESALTPANGTNTVSPFVALQVRA